MSRDVDSSDESLLGSKHWPTESQVKLWKWFTPMMDTIFNQKSNESLSVWSSFFEVGRIPLYNQLLLTPL